MTIISKDAWRERYAARLMSAGRAAGHAAHCAWDALERGAADNHGTPEEAADADLAGQVDHEGAID